MIYRIRIADIPVFLICMAIDLPLMLGFVALLKSGIIAIQDVPDRLFFILFLGFIGASFWVSSIIWKRIRQLMQKT